MQALSKKGVSSNLASPFEGAISSMSLESLRKIVETGFTAAQLPPKQREKFITNIHLLALGFLEMAEAKETPSNFNVFNYEGHKVRTVIKDGESWWVAKDVCEILGISNSRDALSRLDNDEKDGVGLSDTIGRVQQLQAINESGLYALIVRSNKPTARKFRKWVTSEVLPTIRKTGQYIAPSTRYRPSGMEAMPASKKQPPVSASLRHLADTLEKEVEPKAEICDSFLSADGSISISEASRLLNIPGIGRTKVFSALRKLGVLMRRPRNMPMQKYMNKGYFKVIEVTTPLKDLHPYTVSQTLVTPKGMVFLKQLFSQVDVYDL